MEEVKAGWNVKEQWGEKRGRKHRKEKRRKKS
jgi:hypothetical protein